MTCSTCLENCDPLVTDKCTKYTGPDIPELGICKGMSLFEIESIIFAKLQELAQPDIITLSTITTTCSFITTLLFGKSAQPFTLQQFAEIVFDGFCKLDTKIAANVVPAASFNTGCLTGDLTTRDKIIQALITKLCSVDSRLTIIETTYVKQSDFCAQVVACLPEIPEVTPTATQYNSRMVPFTYIPYGGSLSNFDNTGKGLSSAGFDKIYLANGLNGTQDWRGRSPIGAIMNIPGTTLDNDVNPAIPANTSYNYVLGTKYGKSSVALTALESAPHTHSVTDPGHQHQFYQRSYNNGGTQRSEGYATNHNTNLYLYTTELANSNISIGSAGGGNAHTNLHPVVATLFIVYIP